MLADTFWIADGLMLAAVTVMVLTDQRRRRSLRTAPPQRDVDELRRRAQAVFERWAGPGARLVEEPTGRWLALVPIRPGGVPIPLALQAPAGRPDLALLAALRLMALEAPREVTDVQEIYADWCVHHNGEAWNVHIPCRTCGHTRVPLPYSDPDLVDVARLLARRLHRRHGAHGTCPQCVVATAVAA